MSLRKSLALLLILLTLAACGNPVPVYKAIYVGEWQAPQMYLMITQEGRVIFKHYKDGGTVTVKGPLRGFRGDDFIVGYGFATTTFTVTTPPYLSEDASWRMVIDGVELIRTRRLWPAKSGIMV